MILKMHAAGKDAMSNALQADFGKRCIRMGYLISRYPSVSHTFILREVLQLRDAGFEIFCASVNEPDRSREAMNSDELIEMDSTYYLKRHGIAGAISAHFFGLFHPVFYLRGLSYAFIYGGWNIKQWAFGFFYFTEALMLSRWMRANRFKHLHIHFATAAANIALFLKKIASVSISLTVHGPDEFYDAPGQKLTEKINAADFIVCISSFARSQVMKLSPPGQWHKFEVCPLGVNLADYSIGQEGRTGRLFTILCVGRLTPAKGQVILIEACALLRDAGRIFRLVMVGSGPDAQELRGIVSKNNLDELVIFTGDLNQAEVKGWYRESDVFALPSFAEGVPVVLMEAMASGVPCVTTRITGIPELIRDGIDGLLVTPSDVVELVNTVAVLMNDKSLRLKLGEAGRARVSDRYNLQQNVVRLSQIFSARLMGE